MDETTILQDLINAYEQTISALKVSYRRRLKRKDEEIAYLRKLCLLLAQARTTVNNELTVVTESKSMSESTQQNIATGTGSFVNTGEVTLTGSTVNLGTISGAVTNSVTQLRQSQVADAADLATLLSQLQALLEGTGDEVLKPEDKADALEEVKTLAEAAQKPEAEKKGIASKAVRALRRIVDAIPTALPTAAKLLAEFNTLLPTVVKMFGL